MQHIQSIVSLINDSLYTTFRAIDAWFEKDESFREYKPVNGGWSINQILEHVGLTNHFLLILITKGANKALQNIHQLDLQVELDNYQFHEQKLAQIGLHKSFAWMRPEHMEPKGDKPLVEVRRQLNEQLTQCLETLHKLQNGEGLLYKTTMNVNNLGKINVYEYLYFLAQHGQRHLSQMQINEAEFMAIVSPLARVSEANP